MKRHTHQIQISMEIERPKNVILTREFFNAAIHYRSATGEDLPGIRIKGILWTVNHHEHNYQTEADVTDALNKILRMGLKPAFRKMGQS